MYTCRAMFFLPWICELIDVILTAKTENQLGEYMIKDPR